MIIFYEKVDMRSRRAMIDFLISHFRYHTMNSWNNSTSYACNIKIHRLGLEGTIEEKLYDLIQTDEFWDNARELFEQFAYAHQYRWHVGTNGRSGGYLVLYQGGREPSGYLSYCTSCGQQNYTSVKDSGNRCGKCGQDTRVDYTQPPMRTFAYPGKNVDQYEDFSDWDMPSLRDRVRLVQEFDIVTDELVALAISMSQEYEIQDEVCYVPNTHKILVPIIN